jgi:hypothetical protein
MSRVCCERLLGETLDQGTAHEAGENLLLRFGNSLSGFRLIA